MCLSSVVSKVHSGNHEIVCSAGAGAGAEEGEKTDINLAHF